MAEHNAPDEARPESLIRTPESDPPRDAAAAGGRSDDEDLQLRVDTEEWQEYPSPSADPAAPEAVAERMAASDGADDREPGTEEDERRASSTPPGDDATGGSRP